MAASGQQLCDICSLQHVTAEAIEFCPECEENLCNKCKAHHGVAKATRKHETVPLESVSKLPSFVKDIKNYCSEHEEQYLYYCDEHRLACCVCCVRTTHTECRHLSPIQNVVQDVKTSTAFYNLEVAVSDLALNLQNMTADRKKNLSALEEKKLQFTKDIASFRQCINTLLDNFEVEIKNKMQQAFTEKKDTIELLMKDLQTHTDNTSQIQENLGLIKSFASDFQCFLAVQELAEATHKEEIEVERLADSDAMKWIEIIMKTLDLQTFKDHLSSLQTINVEAHPPKIIFKLSKVQEAQLSGSARKVEDIKLTKKLKLIIPKGKKDCEILDCGILPNDNMVFLDGTNKRLIVLTKNGDELKTIHLQFSPIQFSVIDSNTIIVTGGGKIRTVDLQSEEIKTIISDMHGRSISMTAKNYIVEVLSLGGYRGYKVIDFHGNIIQDIPHNFLDHTYHSSVCIKDRLYFLECTLNKLHCYNLDGQKVWEYQDAKLVSPYGLTSDNQNILFITGFKSNNIFAVSIDGKSAVEVVASDKDLTHATSAFYNASRKELLVSTLRGNILLYDDL